MPLPGAAVTGGPGQLFGLRAAMRDGVELSCRVFFPPAGVDGGPYPAVVERSCYSSQLYLDDYTRLCEAGYAVVLQDVRGRGDSDGVFVPMVHEQADGYDTVEWVAGQEWCTGTVGTVGNSYAGWTQWAVLADPPPSLRAAWVTVPAGALLRQEPYDHGVPMLAVLPWLHFTSSRSLQSGARVDWESVLSHVPLSTMDSRLGTDLPTWREWLDHPTWDDYWRSLAPPGATAYTTPTVVSSGWWDVNLRGAVALHHQLAAGGSRAHHLVLGPWGHSDVGAQAEREGWDFPGSSWDVHTARVAWFDRWLRGSAAEPVDPTRADRVVSCYVTGAGAWRSGTHWPPESVPLGWYLGGDETLSHAPPPPAARSYVHDPLSPVPSHAGWDLYPWTVRDGLGSSGDPAVPVLPDSSRPDVLSWTSAPCADDVEVVGEGHLELRVTTDQPDVDWFVTLLDVAGDPLAGRAELVVAEGRLRARNRAGLDREELLTPGEAVTVRLPLRPMAHRFRAGHRLRLLLCSSSFPAYARNPGTGGPVGPEDRWSTVTVTVACGGAEPSALVLPWVNGSAA